MPAALPTHARSAPDAEVDLRFLEHLADQSKRVTVAVFCLLAVMAITAATRVEMDRHRRRSLIGLS
ncbi:MAG: hypothetical protein H7322_02190 [Ramlibacter sp.]|nr:hypothetical protein [Ramlibacter sp.]